MKQLDNLTNDFLKRMLLLSINEEWIQLEQTITVFADYLEENTKDKILNQCTFITPDEPLSKSIRRWLKWRHRNWYGTGLDGVVSLILEAMGTPQMRQELSKSETNTNTRPAY